MQSIYLLRHFKVKDKMNEKVDSKGFERWVEDYDRFSLEKIDINIPLVDRVYVSSMNRAKNTASYFNLDYKETALIQEVEAKPFFKTKLKFKKMFWLISSRLFWYFNLTKHETKKDTINRAKAFIESIDKEDKDILIISHGLFLKILEKELKKIGFKSTLGLGVKNSTIYKLEREDEYTNHRLQ